MDMLAGVLNVEDRLVREIMTPRLRLDTLNAAMTVDGALSVVAGSAHSRFPVIEDEGEDVIGIVHLRDLFNQVQRDPESRVSEITRPVLAVAEVLTVPGLWRRLREEAQHCALVINEYGSVAGLITLEDAIEEIFGEVHDEFDLEDDPISTTGRRVSVRGDVLLDVLNDRFDLGLPAEEIDTVSGLIWHELGRVPVVGDEIQLEPDGIVIRVDAVDGRYVELSSFRLPESAG
jgi:putative hemolysin